MNDIELKYYKIHKDVDEPEYATTLSGCFDLKAYFPQTQKYFNGYSPRNLKVKLKVNQDEGMRFVTIPPGYRAMIGTGLFFDIPRGFCLKIFTRSSSGYKIGVSIPQGVGYIDEDYTDELKLLLQNKSNVDVCIFEHEKLLQGALERAYKPVLKERKTKPKKKSNRNGGIGSTGGNATNDKDLNTTFEGI